MKISSIALATTWNKIFFILITLMLSSSITNTSIPDRHIYFNIIPEYHMKGQSHKIQPKIRAFMKSFETKSKDYQDFTKSCQTRLKWPQRNTCETALPYQSRCCLIRCHPPWWLWPVLFLTFTSNPSLSHVACFFSSTYRPFISLPSWDDMFKYDLADNEWRLGLWGGPIKQTKMTCSKNEPLSSAASITFE